MPVKQNLLLITPYIPYPLMEGGRIAQFSVIDAMRHSFNIVLVLTAKSNEDLNNIAELKGKWSNVIIEIINVIQIQEKEGLKDKIRRVVKRGYSILSGKNRNSPQQSYSEFENSFYINVDVVKTRSFMLQLDGIVKRYPFDLVEIDFVDYIDLVHCFPPGVPKVFVEIEIRFARLKTYLETLGREPDAYEEFILRKVKDKELGFLRLYDGVITMSNDDKIKLDDYLPEGFVFSSPYSVLDSQFIEANKETLKVEKLVLLGAEDHYPNKDGFEWYVNELQPVMKKYRDLPVHVVGKWTKETKDLYKHKANVHFSGFVDDLISYCANSILIVPIRIGSGIRTKIMYGMAQGLPVISTTVGCEGLPVRDKENIWIANNATEFESAIETIMEKPARAIEVLLAGQQLIKKNFSQSASAELRSNYYKKLINAHSNASYSTGIANKLTSI